MEGEHRRKRWEGENYWVVDGWIQFCAQGFRLVRRAVGFHVHAALVENETTDLSALISREGDPQIDALAEELVLSGGRQGKFWLTSQTTTSLLETACRAPE